MLGGNTCFTEGDRRSFPSTESLPTSMSSPRVKPSPSTAATPDKTYQNTGGGATVFATRTPKTKRSNSTTGSPGSSSTAHSSSSLYKKSSPSATNSPPIHKASSQQIAREHSFDGSLYGRHGASFRRRGSGANTNGSVSASSTALRGVSRNGGGSMSGLLMGGLDLIPADNPPPLPPPLNLTHLHTAAKSPKESQDLDAKPQPAPRKQFLKSESVETGIGSGSGSGSNNSSRSNTNNKNGGDNGTLGSTHSCTDEAITTTTTTTDGGADGPGGEDAPSPLYLSPSLPSTMLFIGCFAPRYLFGMEFCGLNQNYFVIFSYLK